MDISLRFVKKLLIAALSVIMVFSAAACSSYELKPATDQGTTAPADQGTTAPAEQGTGQETEQKTDGGATGKEGDTQIDGGENCLACVYGSPSEEINPQKEYFIDFVVEGEAERDPAEVAGGYGFNFLLQPELGEADKDCCQTINQIKCI